MLKTLAALLVAAGLACAAAPAAQHSPVIAPGVVVGNVSVGGLTSEPARTRIAAATSSPIEIADGSTVKTVSLADLGARVGVDKAVTAALAATPGSQIAVPVTTEPARLTAAVEKVAATIDRPAVEPKVTGANGKGPVFAAGRPGRAINEAATRAELAAALTTTRTAPLQLVYRTVEPAKTPATFGPVIVVNRALHRLRLYDGTRLVRTLPVAVGQAIYPTPAGVWRIVDKQKNPWWYPPTYDAWAKGLKPVPPGPDNPLGTRWMGLNATGVGIHGTDEETSIGYSLSHGCVRMHVPDAEWLFSRVHVGTPVVIL